MASRQTTSSPYAHAPRARAPSGRAPRPDLLASFLRVATTATERAARQAEDGEVAELVQYALTYLTEAEAFVQEQAATTG